MAEEVREYVELNPGNDETIQELKPPPITQSINYIVYNCLASLEFLISTIGLIIYVALNTSTIRIVLSALGLFTLSAGCVLSYFAISRLDYKKQTYALIVFCIAALLSFTTSVISLISSFNGNISLFSSSFYSNDEFYPYNSETYGYNPYNPYTRSYGRSYYPYNQVPYYNPYNSYYNYGPYSSPYSSSSSYASVSYSYSYSYSYTTPDQHTVSYSYNFNSNSNPTGSSYSVNTNYNDYYWNGKNDYWVTESTTSPEGSSYSSHNPYTGSKFSSANYYSSDPLKYRPESVIFENESSDGNVLLPITLFIIQGLLFVALITQATTLKNNLKNRDATHLCRPI